MSASAELGMTREELRAAIEDLGFSEPFFDEIKLYLLHMFAPPGTSLADYFHDVIAFLVMVQIVSARDFLSTMKRFGEAAVYAKRAAVETRRAQRALISVPEELRRKHGSSLPGGPSRYGFSVPEELRRDNGLPGLKRPLRRKSGLERQEPTVEEMISVIKASAEQLDQLAASLGKFAQLYPKRTRGAPSHREFAIFIKILASRHKHDYGAWPKISKDRGMYGGKFIRLAEMLFGLGMRVATDWGYAKPEIWPASPNARGRAIERILARLSDD
jgi:hypothetical protein